MQVPPTTNESVKTESAVSHQQPIARTRIEHILLKLSRMELPAKEHFECYMRHKWRINHKPRTLADLPPENRSRG